MPQPRTCQLDMDTLRSMSSHLDHGMQCLSLYFDLGAFNAPRSKYNDKQKGRFMTDALSKPGPPAVVEIANGRRKLDGDKDNMIVLLW